MTRKQGIRAVFFLLILFMIMWILGSVIGMPKDADIVLNTRRFNALYSEEKDIWDGIFIGTSLADRAWAAPLAWEEHGMAVYPMATDGQPFVLSASIIEEVLKYQDISFVMVELHGTRPKTLKASDARMRKVTDNMKQSSTRFNAISKTVAHMDQWYPGYYDETFANRMSYYIPFLKYHKRVTSEDDFYPEDFWPGISTMKGVYVADRHVAANPVKYRAGDAYIEPGEEPKMLLDDLFSFAEENDIQLIFITAPTGMSEEVQGYANGVVQYVKDHGYPVLNFYDETVYAECGIDGKTDFIDMKHLNTAGAYKFTQYVGAWLKENFEIEDHRGDKQYESWDKALEEYRVFYEEALVGIEEWKTNNLKKN